jgi:hypothetical protein
MEGSMKKRKPSAQQLERKRQRKTTAKMCAAVTKRYRDEKAAEPRERLKAKRRNDAQRFERITKTRTSVEG